MTAVTTFPQEFLEQEKNQNKEVEKKISTSERQCAQVRLEYQDSERARLQLGDEVRLKCGYKPVLKITNMFSFSSSLPPFLRSSLSHSSA